MPSLATWLQKLETTPHYLDTPAPQRIKTMLQRLNFHKDFFTITIAGTNGKGTTTHLLANYFHKQGLKVGRFTSPHLIKFNERIAINDIPATDAEIIAGFKQIHEAQANLTLTYFDYSFLASLIIFKEHKINLACLEVGLGGRLDATNAIDTDCAIITTIDLDHQAQLGTSRSAIGFEKAHIMRPHTLCICGDLNPPSTIKEYAEQINAQLYLRNQDFDIISSTTTWQLKTKELTTINMPYPQHIPTQNAATALMSILSISPKLNLPVNLINFQELLLNLQVPGRMQILQEHPQIIIDVAHNPEAAEYLAKKLMNHKISGKTYAIFSALADKDLLGLIKPLNSIIDIWHIFGLDSLRAASLTQLKTAILTINPKAQVHEMLDLNTYTELKEKLDNDDRLIIFGSFLTVSAIDKAEKP